MEETRYIFARDEDDAIEQFFENEGYSSEAMARTSLEPRLESWPLFKVTVKVEEV